jgi:hypothetical protein
MREVNTGLFRVLQKGYTVTNQTITRFSLEGLRARYGVADLGLTQLARWRQTWRFPTRAGQMNGEWWEAFQLVEWEDGMRSLIRSNGWAQGCPTPAQIIQVLGERLPLPPVSPRTPAEPAASNAYDEEADIELLLSFLQDYWKALTGSSAKSITVETDFGSVVLGHSGCFTYAPGRSPFSPA